MYTLCYGNRNNWLRLKRYLTLDFTNQVASSTIIAENLSLTDLKGNFFKGQRKILLPTSNQEALSCGGSKIYDTRQFFLHCDREVLYRRIELRCEVRGFLKMECVPRSVHKAYMYALGNDKIWYHRGQSVNPDYLFTSEHCLIIGGC